jgi:hypothetical protein
LNFGSATSANAFAAALAFATFALRARAADAEYEVLRLVFDVVFTVDLEAAAFAEDAATGFFAGVFAVAAVFVDVEVFLVVDEFCAGVAAKDEAGRPTARAADRTHDRRTVLKDQFRIKRQPLARQLVRSCFGIVANPL